MKRHDEPALRAEIERLERLQAFTAALAEALTPTQVAEVAWGRGLSAMGASSGAFMLLTEDGQALELRGSAGMPDEVVAQFQSLPIEFSIPVAEAVRTRQPVFLKSKHERVTNYPHLANLHPSIDGGAWAGIPLIAEGRVLGAMGLNFIEDREFGEEDRRYLMTVAHQCAQALARARLYDTLRRSEDRFETIFRVCPIAILIVDTEAVIRDVNEAFTHLTGWTSAEAIGRKTLELGLWADVAQRTEMLAELHRTGTSRGRPAMLRCKSGEVREVQGAAELVNLGGMRCIVSMIDDVTEMRRLESELRQSQKMEAVGRLAGGIAHDFNNILTAISGYAGLLCDALEPASDARANAEQIRRSAERASALTRQLLAFSRKQVLTLVDLDLGEVVRGLESLLRRLIGEDVELVLELAPDLGRVRADRGQIEQVVLNLAVNARDAMPQGGRLTISTRRRDRSAVLAVRDTGHGMSEDMRARIFEPFFTTKAPDRGTGLGLSTVYGIVRQCGGQVRVESELGRGATFEVELPMTEAATGAPTPVPPPRPAERGCETILLVEDDADVRDFTRHVLELHGYRVLCAPNGAEAIARAREYGDAIDLLITDVVMPQMRGHQVAEQLGALRPGIRVLLMSGYPGDAVDPDLPFLEKPFTVAQLVGKVREALTATSSP